MPIDPYVGEISVFSGKFAPDGWCICNGQLLDISQYQILYSIIGANFGGNGVTNFALPDLRFRAVIGSGRGPGLTYRDLGEYGGYEELPLWSGSLPEHSHTLRAAQAPGSQNSPENGVIADDGHFIPIFNTSANSKMQETSETGGGEYHTNMQPYLILNYIIAWEGTYPPRH